MNFITALTDGEEICADSCEDINGFVSHFRGTADVVMLAQPFVVVWLYIIMWVPMKFLGGRPLFWVRQKQWPIAMCDRMRDYSYRPVPFTPRHFWWWTNEEVLILLFVSSVPAFLFRFLPLTATGQLAGVWLVAITSFLGLASRMSINDPQPITRMGYPYSAVGNPRDKVAFAASVLTTSMCLNAINYPAIESMYCSNTNAAIWRFASSIFIIPSVMTTGMSNSQMQTSTSLLRDVLVHFGCLFVVIVFQLFGYVSDLTCEDAPELIRYASTICIGIAALFCASSPLIVKNRLSCLHPGLSIDKKILWCVWVLLEWCLLGSWFTSALVRYHLSTPFEMNDVLLLLPVLFTCGVVWHLKSSPENQIAADSKRGK